MNNSFDQTFTPLKSPIMTTSGATQGLVKLKVKELKNALTIRHFGYMSNVILMVALCLGMYSRWMLSEQFIILIISIMGLFIFAISCALVYYFSQEALGTSLARLWMGCLLGVVAFTEEVMDNYATLEEVMNILFMTSIITRCFWSVLERILRIPRNQLLFNPYEALEMIGMAAATFVCDKQSASLSLLVLALAVTLVAIRLKSYLAVLNLLAIIIMATVIYFPRLVQTPVNYLALGCFISRLAFEPVVDIFLGGMTTMERWQPLMKLPSYMRRLGILAIFSIDVTYYAFLAKQMPSHKEWFIVVPIFSAFSIVWWCYHIVFTITCWQLMSKITDCNLTYNNMQEDARNMANIMAAKGVRHFSLIAQRLTLVTLLSSIILHVIGWTTMTGVSLSLLFIVVPIEAAIMSLLWQMGRILGGTCTGYGLVAPTFSRPSTGSPVLPTSALQEVGSRATKVLTTIQQFFANHLIEVYGCDYSSTGLTAETVEAKLRSFFQRHTSDGPRFDTYLLYYCGHVHRNGEWALAGNGSLKLETIIEWWRDLTAGSGSRLILVLDTDNSHQWLRTVRGLRQDIVAIQTCQMKLSRDPEGEVISIGDFTHEWTSFNSNRLTDTKFLQAGQPLRAMYAVSSCWTDFEFRPPTEQDMDHHWDANFPKITKPLIKITNFPQMGSTLCCLDCLLRCLRRKRMLWLPPQELNTGHGFRLVRSR